MKNNELSLRKVVVITRTRGTQHLQEIASGTGTAVHNRLRTAMTWDSRPHFTGVGCVLLRLFPA